MATAAAPAREKSERADLPTTIKIAASGDSHFDITSRWEECLRIHDWMNEDMNAREVKLFIHCGDWFERGSKIQERNAVRAWLQRVAKSRPVIGVKGNHDALGDLDVFNHIRSFFPVLVEEFANVHLVDVLTSAGSKLVETKVAIAAVAWPQKAQLLSTLDRQISYEESEAVARDLIRTMMLGLRDQLAAHDGPRILVMHGMISGSSTSAGQPLVGCDLEVSIEDLALAEPDLILLGHIHKPQEWTTASGVPVIYCGSPYATAYGETEPKSYVLAEFTPRRTTEPTPLVRWQRIETPRTPMVLIDVDYNAETKSFEAKGKTEAELLAVEALMKGEVVGADVRFRYNVDPEFHDEATAASQKFEEQFRDAGAAVVKIEEIKNSTARARAPEIVQALSLSDKLPILWKAKGNEPEPERAARLLNMAQTLETERQQNAG